MTPANQTAQIRSCDRLRIPVHDLGGKGAWPGKKIITSSNRNIFHVTVTLCGESTGDRWIPLTKGQQHGPLMFLFCLSKQSVGQTLDWPVIRDAMAIIWRRRNDSFHKKCKKLDGVTGYLITFFKSKFKNRATWVWWLISYSYSGRKSPADWFLFLILCTFSLSNAWFYWNCSIVKFKRNF